jgi:hypothetical protein
MAINENDLINPASNKQFSKIVTSNLKIIDMFDKCMNDEIQLYVFILHQLSVCVGGGCYRGITATSVSFHAIILFLQRIFF